MTTFDYKDNWFVWSESQDAELRVGSSIGENWAVYAADLRTGEIIFVDGETISSLKHGILTRTRGRFR